MVLRKRENGREYCRRGRQKRWNVEDRNKRVVPPKVAKRRV
jgi:hypothetical protein